METAVRELTKQKNNLEAANESLKLLVGNLQVSNDFARFQTERISQSYAESIKARYLSPETSTFTMAQEQMAELLQLLGEERDLTNDLQQRLDTEIIISQSLELGAQDLREKHAHAMEAVDDLRSQKEQMLTRISRLETLCGERYQRIAVVERELQKAKSVTPESQGSTDMEMGGVSLTATTGSESCQMSSPSQTKPIGYAVCLIDGNHLPFAKDSIYILGGDTTARRLTEGVRSLLQDDDLKLRVVIYVDADRIAPAMVRSQVLHSVYDFRPFADSLNSVSPLVEMVDTRSPERITQKLKLHLEDPKCEFILLGGEISRDLMGLAQHYKVYQRRFLAFSNPEELLQPECQNYIHPNPLGYLFGQQPLEFLTRSDVEPKRPLARSQVGPKPSAGSTLENGSSSAVSHVVHEPVRFDRYGRRVDPRLHTTQSLINLVTSWRLCNNHYLLGQCLYRRCHHSHTRQLSKNQLNALAFLGRSLVCRNGPACDDPTCYAGHTCPRQTCDGQQCGFARDRHLDGTIKPPQIGHAFSNITTQDTAVNTSATQGNSNTSASFSSPAGGDAILPDTTGTSKIKVEPTDMVAAHWSRMRDEDESPKYRPDLFAGRQSSWRQH